MPKPRTELGLIEGYARWAKRYDANPNDLIAIEEPPVEAMLQRLRFRAALDVGAGTGRHLPRLARSGGRVTAIDQSPEMLAYATRRASAERLRIDFALASLECGLPFADGAFDLIVCALMLCHVPDLLRAGREFYRVLGLGGHLLVTDFHPDARAFGWRTLFHEEEHDYALPNVAHERGHYLDALTDAGFKLRQTLDIPFGAVPDGFNTNQFRADHAELNFCFVALAQKQNE